MKRALKKQPGFALVMTILSLLIISILGLAIIEVTTSNFKMVKLDSSTQSAYYIAEAGVNYMIDSINTEVKTSYTEFGTGEEFFENIENLFTKNTVTINKFESNNGQQPKAMVNVESIGSTGDSRDYKIESIGEIGNSKRKLSAVISINWAKQEDNELIKSILFYTQNFSFSGATVNAKLGSAVMDGIVTYNLNGGSALNISNMYFNGPVKMDNGSASFGSKDEPGKIYVNGNLELWSGTRNVYGEIRVNGDFRLKDARIYGDVYVNGDLELGWTPQIHKNIYYTGELIAPSSYNTSLLDKCIKVDSVDSFEIPVIDFSLREDSWYNDHGYKIEGDATGNIPENAKMLVNNYINTKWQEIKGQVIIVSKGDIILRGGNGFTGALIAPNGKVQYSGDGTFNGIIIAKEISLPKGGSTINYKSFSEVFGEDINDIPVVANSTSEGNEDNEDNDSSTTDVKVTIKSSVKEE